MTSFQIFVQSQFEKGYVALVIGLPDCVAEGKTEEEAIANAKEALDLWFEPTEIPLADSAKLIEVSA